MGRKFRLRFDGNACKDAAGRIDLDREIGCREIDCREIKAMPRRVISRSRSLASRKQEKLAWAFLSPPGRMGEWNAREKERARRFRGGISGSMLEYENSEESALPPRFWTARQPFSFSFLSSPSPSLSLSSAVAVAFPESFTGGACKLAQRRPPSSKPAEEVGRSRWLNSTLRSPPVRPLTALSAGELLETAISVYLYRWPPPSVIPIALDSAFA